MIEANYRAAVDEIKSQNARRGILPRVMPAEQSVT
jgi:hypothetical protein